MDSPTSPDDHPRSIPKDRRGVLTFKGSGFDAEFRALINKAASRLGMTQSAFVEVTLREAAQRVVKGNPDSNPISHPPVPAPAPTQQPDRLERAMIELAETVARLASQQASQAAAPRIPWWDVLHAKWVARREAA